MLHGYPGTTVNLLQGENFCTRKSQTDEWKSEVSKDKQASRVQGEHVYKDAGSDIPGKKKYMGVIGIQNMNLQEDI